MSATPKWVTIVMGAAVAATMLGACSATPAATPSPALTTAGSANPSNAAAHNEADTAFAQMMIVPPRLTMRPPIMTVSTLLRSAACTTVPKALPDG